MSDLSDVVERYIEEHFPTLLRIPTGVSEADAIRSIQEQYGDAGFECSVETARGLLKGNPWSKAGK